MKQIHVRTVATLLGMLIGASAACAATIPLERLNGWPILIAEDAIPSECYAAEECQWLLGLVLGSEPPIQSLGSQKKGIFIGPSALAKAHRAAFHALELGEEGCFIDISRSALVIAGGRPRGTLYAVYEFFERFCGVRFLTFDHTYVPPDAASLRIPIEHVTYVPPFSFRWPYYRENRDHPEFAARLRCNTVTSDERLGGATPQRLIGHSYCSLVPIEKYGKTNPDYFALRNGRRATSGYSGPQICVTNPEVMDLVTAAVLKQIEEHPEQRNFVVSQNDNSDYCQCPACQAINDREGSPMGANLAFVNTVAERIAETHPEVMIGTLAYSYTRKAPKTIRPRENVQIQLCSIECCCFHPINDLHCEENRAFAADLAEWKEITDNIWIWNYNTNFRSYDLPFPNLRAIGANVRFFAENHARGVFMQANGQSIAGEMSDLRNYVIGRCLWRPGLDSWELAEEFCRLHYAEAAAPILEFLTATHDAVEKAALHPACFPTAAEVGLTPALAEQGMRLFDEALSMAGSETIRRRVEQASLCAYKAVISTHSNLHFDDGLLRIDVPTDLVEHYLALQKKYGVTRVVETSPLEEYRDDLRKLTEGLPGLQIENETWRVSVAPTLTGRVVEMTHKPTGRNLLHARNRVFYRILGMEIWGKEGYEETEPREFQGEVDSPSSIRLWKTLPNGAHLEQAIALGQDGRQGVHFTISIQQAPDATPTAYQFHVHPEYDLETQTRDDRSVAAYVLRDMWQQVNQGFLDEESAAFDRLKDPGRGAYAFYCHERNFGVIQRFDPEQFESLSLYWRPARYQLNLEMNAKRFMLDAGERGTVQFSVDYLDTPPHGAAE